MFGRSTVIEKKCDTVFSMACSLQNIVAGQRKMFDSLEKVVLAQGEEIAELRKKIEAIDASVGR